MIMLPRPIPPTIMSVGPVCGSSIAPDVETVDAGTTTGAALVTVVDAVLALAGAAD